MNIRQTIANFIAPPHKNALGDGDGLAMARDFMRHGPRQPLYPDWHQVLMSERDKYTGYMYGASTRRANKVAMLATYNLHTAANAKTEAQAVKDKSTIRHPYLSVIDESPGFENDLFWRALQTWLDVRGVAYLLAVRGKLQDDVGPIKYFDLLWPNEITVMRDASNFEIIGYTQSVGGFSRDLPPHMVIMIKDFNPFSRTEFFSLADAAGDSHFNMRESSENMRMTSRRNRTYPGVAYIQGENVALDQEGIANFKSRLRSKASSGEPVFAKAAAGKGSLDWNDMQIDLRKSAVDMVSEVNLNEFMAVSGISKTKFNIEQSGVTRDSSETQEALFIADHAMPALQKIIDALNEDYKTHYQADYEKYGYKLEIKSPLGDDKEAEGKDIKNRTTRFELYTSLRGKGYSHDVAAAYAKGEKDLASLGEPTETPAGTSNSATANGDASAKELSTKADAVGTLVRSGFDPNDSAKVVGIDGVKHLGFLPVTVKTDEPAASANPAANAHSQSNAALPPSKDATAQRQREALENAVIAIQRQLVQAVITKVTRRNEFKDASDVVDDDDRKAAEADLELALVTIYRILLPLAAATTMSERIKEFGLLGTFRLDGPVNDYIKVTATRAASDHIETILGDILKTARETEERLVQDEMKKIKAKPGQTPESILKEARRLALDGNGREAIARAIRETYEDKVSKVRATTIARSETNRVYNRAQFEADRQFLEQNKLTAKAYKKWRTRSNAPCAYCVEMSKRPPIPFDQAFAKVGDTIKATFTKEDGTPSLRQMQVGFEDCMAGEIHPNGMCDYVLIIVK